MVSFITSLFNLFANKTEDNDVYNEEFLAEEILNLEFSDTNNYEIEKPKTTEIPRNVECFQRTGVITYIDENYVLIDGMFYFDTSACSVSFNLNDKVLYLGYVDSNESVIIVRLLQNQGIFWGEENDIEENKFNILEHVIVGEVDYREERFVYIKDNDLKFCLDDVVASFIPLAGDWLEMKCKVQWDEDKPSDISAAQVLQVLAVKPLRTKIKKSVVTDWSGESGTCDWQIYYDKQSLQNGIVPLVGSKVFVEAIESNQGKCVWRAIKLEIEDPAETINVENQIDKKQKSTLTIENELNIDVTDPLKFDNVSFNEITKLTLNITNNSDQVYVINKWIVLSKKRDSQIDVTPILTRPKKLYPKQMFYLTITCKPKFLGKTREHMIIMFRGFQIERFIEINTVDKYIQQQSQNNITKTRNNNNYMSDIDKIEKMKIMRRNGHNSYIPGVRLIKPPHFVPIKLGQFPIPDRIWSVVLGDSKQTIHSSDYNKILTHIETYLPCLSQELKIHNYTDRWHTLMYMEEIQANINIRIYDMPKVFLIRCGEYLGVEIMGLCERRPSLIKGDSVMVKDIWNDETPKYEGFIHNIQGTLVLVKFNQKFHECYTGSDVSIEFHFNRSVYRKAHQAINLAISHLGPDILFPSKIKFRLPQLTPEKLNDLKWYNGNLNDCQKSAVRNILLGESRPLPYCIYGPPGTGKTMTVIEVILQILTLLPDSRILVATPSNSASNLVTERLIQYSHVSSYSIIRIIANYLLDTDKIPEKIRPFCATLDIAREETIKSRHVVHNGMNLNCQKSFIGRHRVIIGTCVCIGTLAQMGLPKGHFTHIIVDEAGQATEPEIMIPMTFTDKENGQIILAGDPKQLGPTIISKYCVEFGMEQSYLSRVLDTFPYQRDYVAFKDGFNDKVVTMLVDNYRSLQEILTLPSEMFYNSSLVAKVNPNQTWSKNIIEALMEIFELNDAQTGGIYVYGIKGSNARAEDSPSWYNPQEASMVALTTCKLLKKNISTDDIGIITPYIAQIKYLRMLFDAMGLPQPKIGSVEEFQGQERPVILISTVRSTEAYLAEDQKHSLGFVKSPKRLNVALTRAQVAAIVFCDPVLLSKDQLWHKVINYAVKYDKYIGCDLPFCYDDQ